MSSLHAAVIVNPIKQADVEQFRRTVSDALTARGAGAVSWFETTAEDPGVAMAQEAIAAAVDLVLVAGGDGTVRVVCAELAGTGIAVAVLPAGTGNLLARNLGISLVMETALAQVLDGTERRIDSVRISGDDLPDDRFLVMAGLGLDAAIIDDAPDDLKKRVGWAAYVISTVKNLNHPAFRVELTIDDQPPIRRRARTVVIGNVGTLQANIPLLPDASADDGVIDLVVLAPQRISHWPRLVLSLVIRRWRERDIERFTGKRIQVRSDRSTRRQLDGDMIDPGRILTAEVDPSSLLVRVPKG
ncbi:diacylglycerol kinase family protein [Kribbella sp. NBC_01505]|uniref:diacylglycerol/lipid kinase family protein n=1 Tax=Kribbella sp. NBC_01505 TaxID=2903580 RepID=UPI003865C8AB